MKNKIKIKASPKTTRAVNRAILKVKKYSPEILLVSGCAGVVVSGVMACKASTKASAIMEETKKQMEEIKTVSETTDKELYSEEDLRKDTAIVYTKMVMNYIKLYGPAVAVGVLSLASIITAHGIIKKRNVALAAAYATVDGAFKDYRNRVIDRFGDEVDKQLKYNIKTTEVEEKTTNSKGKEKVTKKKIEVCDLDPSNYSEYARIFDNTCVAYTGDPEHDMAFLRLQQNYANDKLRIKGYLFLSDVYDMLGFPRTKASQCVGWVYDEKNPSGDNFVDFGLLDTSKVNARKFVNGYENCVIVDFNVDGNILDLI